jgi:hypothetical protein
LGGDATNPGCLPDGIVITVGIKHFRAQVFEFHFENRGEHVVSFKACDLHAQYENARIRD